MRALLRDAQDQTRIALEVEEAVYDPKDNKLFLYTTSETCYAVSKVVRANADSIIEELVMKGYSNIFWAVRRIPFSLIFVYLIRKQRKRSI